MITKKEQELLVSMLEKPITFKTQNIFKNRCSFYRAIWKLRDMELVYPRQIEVNGRKVKEWRLRLDGVFLARILKKGDENRNNPRKIEAKR